MDQLCPNKELYWAKMYVTNFVRAAHFMIYFYFSKPKFTLKVLKLSESQLQ